MTSPSRSAALGGHDRHAVARAVRLYVLTSPREMRPQSLLHPFTAERSGPARKAASFPTQPSSAEPRVCCQVRPSMYRPGEGVTPRVCRMRPWSSLACRTSIHEWSAREPGRPHHGVELGGAAVGEGHRPSGRAGRTGPEADAVAPGEPPRPGPDHLVPPGQASSQPRVRGHLVQPQRGRPVSRCRGPAAAAGSPGSAGRPTAPPGGSPRVPGRSGSRSSRRRPPGRFPAEPSAGAGSWRCGPGARRGRARRRSAG